MPAQKLEELIDYKKLLFTYINNVLLWRRTALAIAWAVCAIGWTAIALLPDSYRSEARIYVDTQTLLNPLLKGIAVHSDDQRAQDIAIMQQTLTSRSNLEKVAQLTDLDKSADSPAELQELIDRLQKHIEVTNEGYNLFKIDFSDNSPKMAKRVVQALLTLLVDSNVGDRRTDLQTARSFIETQLAEYSNELRQSENRLADFKAKNLDFTADANEDFSARLEQARTIVKERSDDLEDLMDQATRLKSQFAATPQFLSIAIAPKVVIGRGGSPLQQRIRALQNKVDDLRTQYTDKFPELVRSRKMLRDLRVQATKINAFSPGGIASADGDEQRSEIINPLHVQLSLQLSDLKEKITSAKHHLDDAKDALADLQNEAGRVPAIAAQYTALTRDYQVLKDDYDSLLARRESARITEAEDSSTDAVQFRIIAQPEEPASPTGPDRRIFNIVIFVLGVAAGCASAVVLAKIADCVAEPDDLSEFKRGFVAGCISDTGALLNARSFLKRQGRAIIYAGALFILCLTSVLTAPNLSTIPQTIESKLLLL